RFSRDWSSDVCSSDLRQSYATDYNPSYAGELRVPLASMSKLPFTERKIVARRAALELRKGAVCNLGAGISTGVSSVAAEEGILEIGRASCRGEEEVWA